MTVFITFIRTATISGTLALVFVAPSATANESRAVPDTILRALIPEAPAGRLRSGVLTVAPSFESLGSSASYIASSCDPVVSILRGRDARSDGASVTILPSGRRCEDVATKSAARRSSKRVYEIDF